MVYSGHVTVTSGEKCPTMADIAQLPIAHAQNIFPNRAVSGQGLFRSRDWRHFRSRIRNGPILIDPPQILLCNHIYTTGGREFENVSVGWAAVCVGTLVVVVHGAGKVGQLSLVFAKIFNIITSCQSKK